jgi:hypothetical protein
MRAYFHDRNRPWIETTPAIAMMLYLAMSNNPTRYDGCGVLTLLDAAEAEEAAAADAWDNGRAAEDGSR